MQLHGGDRRRPARAWGAALVVVLFGTTACGTGGDLVAPLTTVTVDGGGAAGGDTSGSVPATDSGTEGSDDTGDGGAVGSTGPAGGDPGSTGQPRDPARTDHGEPDFSMTPRDRRERATRPDQCHEEASAPWSAVDYESDPLAAVRTGTLLDPRFAPADGAVVTDFPTVESYEDISTLDDPEGLRSRWRELGYADGTTHVYESGAYLQAVTAVRFRDAASARQALSAHLSDYCSRSVEAQRLPAGNGINILRDLGAVRTLWVQGDVMLSVFVCVCYTDHDVDRLEAVQGWAEGVAGQLGTGEGPATPPAV